MPFTLCCHLCELRKLVSLIDSQWDKLLKLVIFYFSKMFLQFLSIESLKPLPFYNCFFSKVLFCITWQFRSGTDLISQNTLILIIFSSLTFQTFVLHPFNEGKSAASFRRQVAAWFPDIFCNFYLVKNHKIAKNSTTTKVREKISTDVESLEF